MRKFIFDVDGTLTPSRGKINEDFRLWFMTYMDEPDIRVYLVTGSDYIKTKEQLGDYFLQFPEIIYNCSGNQKRQGGQIVFEREWFLPDDVKDFLEKELSGSAFPLRTGQHIEQRPGLVNFSIVGRGATLGERNLYKKWDTEYNEREIITHNFNRLFPELQATIGGETGIDISPRGFDKSQIIHDFDEEDELYFFGDAIYVGGNDYTLAQEVVAKKGQIYCVSDWKETWQILKRLV